VCEGKFIAMSSLQFCEGLSNQHERAWVTIDYAADKNCFQFIRYECAICVFVAVSLLLEKFVERYFRDIAMKRKFSVMPLHIS